MPDPFHIPYRFLPADPTPRPWLGMWVTGPNGQPRSVYGLVDSGADVVSFPLGWATELGFHTNTLGPPQPFGQAGGVGGSCQIATLPIQAIVPEIPSVIVNVVPVFIDGAQYVLWGRAFMMSYHVGIDEPNKRFSIQQHAVVTNAS